MRHLHFAVMSVAKKKLNKIKHKSLVIPSFVETFIGHIVAYIYIYISIPHADNLQTICSNTNSIKITNCLESKLS